MEYLPERYAAGLNVSIWRSVKANRKSQGACLCNFGQIPHILSLNCRPGTITIVAPRDDDRHLLLDFVHSGLLASEPESEYVLS